MFPLNQCFWWSGIITGFAFVFSILWFTQTYEQLSTLMHFDTIFHHMKHQSLQSFIVAALYLMPK